MLDSESCFTPCALYAMEGWTISAVRRGRTLDLGFLRFVLLHAPDTGPGDASRTIYLGSPCTCTTQSRTLSLGLFSLSRGSLSLAPRALSLARLSLSRSSISRGIIFRHLNRHSTEPRQLWHLCLYPLDADLLKFYYPPYPPCP